MRRLLEQRGTAYSPARGARGVPGTRSLARVRLSQPPHRPEHELRFASTRRKLLSWPATTLSPSGGERAWRREQRSAFFPKLTARTHERGVAWQSRARLSALRDDRHAFPGAASALGRAALAQLVP